ncbi:YkgJ family cysteine cluster protein [Bacillus sp. V3B]|uniref:YkgJ family cysteine cluster protein n=1 Tax=Bacillus sp. V3B TaxID=2804915 RepID=UPI00210F0F09|nr:YkgJ family cysteine cluster protein [Bacillus sp. V3B]MCQ6274710.1 YkgJ family cysteine cluster protein [Bacillus sp. V3B]
MNKIGRNDACPCGSGKKYKHCHDKSNDQWNTLNVENYHNKPIFDNISHNARIGAKLSKLNTKIEMQELKGIIPKQTGLNYLKELYSILDEGTSIIGNQSSCTKGCSSCCYQLVEITESEYELIKSNIKESYDEFKENLATANKYTPTIYPSGKTELDRHFGKMTPCPFLDENQGMCRIYSSRPLNCRTHFVFNDPKDCSIPGGVTKEFSSHLYGTQVSILLEHINDKFFNNTASKPLGSLSFK